jgi:hypothetical protein
LFNVNSDRAAGSFSVPVPEAVTLSGVSFHDVNYHSGEPYDAADWTFARTGPSALWSSEDFASNPNANALRWSTTYNFRFDADAPPEEANLTIGLFKPGTPETLTVSAPAPGMPAACNCETAAECDGGTQCILPTCIDCQCGLAPRYYGDADGNGALSLFDVFCILKAIGGDFSACAFADADLEPCGGNGTLNLTDIFALLDAIGGVDACCDE